MKNKAPLTMMEQVIMLLVFALAAAICLQIFTVANQKSKSVAAQAHAMTMVQSAAEILKHTGGDYDRVAELLGGTTADHALFVTYDADWNVSDVSEIAYCLTAAPADTSQPFLAHTEVRITDADGKLLFSLPVSWQTGGAE